MPLQEELSQAIMVAKSFVLNIYSENDPAELSLRVEEVRPEDHGVDVTLSINMPMGEGALSHYTKRDYKVVRVIQDDQQNYRATSMRMRELDGVA